VEEGEERETAGRVRLGLGVGLGFEDKSLESMIREENGGKCKRESTKESE